MRSKPHGKARTVHLDGEVWWYLIGRSSVLFWTPEGDKHVVHRHYGHWPYGDAITPANVENHIRRKILGDKALDRKYRL